MHAALVARLLRGRPRLGILAADPGILPSAALIALGFAFTLRLVPETRGHGLEDMRTAWAERGIEIPAPR